MRSFFRSHMSVVGEFHMCQKSVLMLASLPTTRNTHYSAVRHKLQLYNRILKKVGCPWQEGQVWYGRPVCPAWPVCPAKDMIDRLPSYFGRHLADGRPL